MAREDALVCVPPVCLRGWRPAHRGRPPQPLNPAAQPAGRPAGPPTWTAGIMAPLHSSAQRSHSTCGAAAPRGRGAPGRGGWVRGQSGAWRLASMAVRTWRAGRAADCTPQTQGAVRRRRNARTAHIQRCYTGGPLASLLVQTRLVQLLAQLLGLVLVGLDVAGANGDLRLQPRAAPVAAALRAAAAARAGPAGRAGQERAGARGGGCGRPRLLHAARAWCAGGEKTWGAGSLPTHHPRCAPQRGPCTATHPPTHSPKTTHVMHTHISSLPPPRKSLCSGRLPPPLRVSLPGRPTARGCCPPPPGPTLTPSQRQGKPQLSRSHARSLASTHPRPPPQAPPRPPHTRPIQTSASPDAPPGSAALSAGPSPPHAPPCAERHAPGCRHGHGRHHHRRHVQAAQAWGTSWIPPSAPRRLRADAQTAAAAARGGRHARRAVRRCCCCCCCSVAAAGTGAREPHRPIHRPASGGEGGRCYCCCCQAPAARYCRHA